MSFVLEKSQRESKGAAETNSEKKVRRSAQRAARLEFRLSREAKEKIEKAALATGQSVSDFACSTLLREAGEVLANHNVTTLSDRDRDIFLQLLDNPPAPSPALAQAAADYQRRAQIVGNQTRLDSPPEKPSELDADGY